MKLYRVLDNENPFMSLPYNPRQLPVPMYQMWIHGTHHGNYVHIWEETRSDHDYIQRRVYAAYEGKQLSPVTDQGMVDYIIQLIRTMWETSDG